MERRSIIFLAVLSLMSGLSVGCAPSLAPPNQSDSALVIGRVEVNNTYSGEIFGLLPVGLLRKGLGVEIERQDGKQSFSANTDEQGYFLIPNVPPETFYIRTLTIEGGRSGGDKEKYTISLRRPTFTPVSGKINYIGTVQIDISERAETKVREVRETETSRSYFRQNYADSA